MSSLYLTDRAKNDIAIGPVNRLRFVLGSASGYSPGPSSAGIRGSQILSGEAADPVPVEHNLYKYVLSLSAADDLVFGEIAMLYPDNGLFGLCVFAQPQTKSSIGGDIDGIGGSLNVFVTTTGVAEVQVNAGFQLGQLKDIDNLPLTQDSRYMMYVVPSPREPKVPMMVVKESYLWGFSAYSLFRKASIVSATLTSLTIEGKHQMDENDIIQVGSGSLSAAVRRVRSSTMGELNTAIAFFRPLTEAPATGSQVYLFRPNYAGTPATTGSDGTGSDLFLPRDGSKAMYGTLQMGNQRISDQSDPQFDTDGSNKRYTDATRFFRSRVIPNATGTIVLNLDTHDLFTLTLVGNVNVAFTGGKEGQRVILRVKQDQVGGRTLTLPATVRTSLDVGTYQQKQTTSANAVDLLGLIPDTGSNRQDLVSITSNFM